MISTSGRRRVAVLAASGLAFVPVLVGAAGPAAAAAPAVPGTYVAVSPTRVLDTRTGAYGNRKGSLPAHGHTTVRVVGASGVPTSASGVVMTITVVAAARSGGITASTSGLTAAPNVTNLLFAQGKTATDLAVVKPTSGSIALWNESAGWVQLVVDVTGYYVGGNPVVDGAMHLQGPRRVVDTRTGLNGFHRGALGGGATLTADLHALAGLPANAGAVAATITVLGPSRSGTLIAYAGGTTRPSAPLLQFTAGRAVSQYAVLPISDIQGLSLYNGSAGSAQVLVDVTGYLTNGPAAVPSAEQVVTANRAYSDAVLPSRASDAVPIPGQGGVPKAGVRAVAVSVQIRNPARAGTIVGGSGGAPIVASFSPGQSVVGQVILPVVRGAVTLRNTSTGNLGIEVDVVGYYPSDSLVPPTAVTVARYTNDLTADVVQDQDVMKAHGQQDASAGVTFALLDLGAQTVTSPLSANNPGIALAGTDLGPPTHDPVRLSLPDLVTIIESYIDGLGGRTVRLAVGTNNDGDWSAYLAAARGTDFASNLIVPLAAYGASRGVTVVGANDIEATFGSHIASDALMWETAYYGATAADLIFNGALVNCPTVFGSTAKCDYGWTQQDYWNLTHYVVNGRDHAFVLPQIYFPVQAVQWANIYANGGGGQMQFMGALTEHGADASTYTPAQGWAALMRALQWRVRTPGLAQRVDIAPAA
jgi:hypothetical protein